MSYRFLPISGPNIGQPTKGQSINKLKQPIFFPSSRSLQFNILHITQLMQFTRRPRPPSYPINHIIQIIPTENFAGLTVFTCFAMHTIDTPRFFSKKVPWAQHEILSDICKAEFSTVRTDIGETSDQLQSLLTNCPH